LPTALSSYKKSLEIREKLTERHPDNIQWQRDLSVSYEKIGDARRTLRDLPTALIFYKRSLEIREKLTESDPYNIQWQRDLSVSYEKIGDVQQSDLPNALSSYKKSLEIREKLAARDPANAQWQRDLSVNYEKVGIVQSLQGDLDNAYSSYKNSYRAATQAIGAHRVQGKGLLARTVAAYQKSALQFTQEIFSSYYNLVRQDKVLHDMWRAFRGAERFFWK
jgi:tetratricopeptide (TPR) repeat protein